MNECLAGARLRARAVRLSACLAALATLSAGSVATLDAADPVAPVAINGDAIVHDDDSTTAAKAAKAPSGKPASARSEPQRQRGTRSSRRRRSSRARVAAAPVRKFNYTTPRSGVALGSDLGAMLGGATRSGQWGAMVVSLTRGDTLFALNPGEQLMPASTMKLYTAAVALERFGPDYQLGTAVLRDGELSPEGTVRGNLILRGDGDPGLSNRFVKGTPGAPMDALAAKVAASGVREVTGDIIGDASAFEAQRIPDGWLTRYLGAGYAARVSALSLNENLVAVYARPGAGKGQAVVTFEPATTTLQLDNRVRTVPGSAGAKLSIVRRSDGVVQASGWIGSRSGPRGYVLVVDDPALFTTGAFRAALERAGVKVGGQARLGESPASAELVTTLPSAPLSQLVAIMNRESINHYAELLFRNAARGPERNRMGTAKAGDSTLALLLAEKAGTPAGTVYAADGSGLSTLDRVTARSLVQLLAWADKAPWSSTFHASLPVAGESETLRTRMRFTPAQGNLHAKTGTTNEVISLAGYATAVNGEVIAFAFVYNGRDRWNARAVIDAMGATVANFGRD